MKPLTYYIDNPSVRVFQTFAGETLENLDELEAWDIITVLCQSAALANLNDETTLDIPNAILALSESVQISGEVRQTLNALHGFPAIQVNQLMAAILQVAFDVDQLETHEQTDPLESMLSGLNSMFDRH